MATQNGAGAIPAVIRENVELAQKRLTAFEKDATKLAKQLIAKGRTAQKEISKDLGDLRKRLQAGTLFEDARLRKFRGRAQNVRKEIVKRLAELQGLVLNFVGLASRDEVSELARELRELAKQLEKGGRTGRRSKGSDEAEA